MTDKEQIIINGVDVSKCDRLIVNQLYGYACNCEEDTHIISSCKNRHNCYYKQLARKTQECEALKSESFTREELITIQEKEIEELKEYAQCQENQRETYYQEFLKLSQENKELKRKVELMMDCPDCKVDEYKKALDEIERICLEDVRIFADGTVLRYDSLDAILDIINKLKGGNDE